MSFLVKPSQGQETSSFVDWSTGSGFLMWTASKNATAVWDFQSVRSIQYVASRIHPFAGRTRWQAISIQMGLIRINDSNFSASDCGSQPISFIACYTLHSSSYYSGLSVELVELTQKEAKPLQIRFGIGGTNLRPNFTPPSLLPYTSLDIIHQLKSGVDLELGFLATTSLNMENWAFMIPTFKLEYKF